MTSPRRFAATLALVFALPLALVACGSSDASSSESGAAPADTAWQDLEITDTEGATFSIAELQGTPVFVENFATWCSNCRQQLEDTQQAAAEAGEDAVFVALSVETDIDPDDVASYAADNGFDDIRFAVMTPEMLAAMDAAYGKSSLNPPVTPKIVVDASGEAGSLTTGFESPATIAEQLTAASS